MARVREVLDDPLIGRVAVPQLISGHWICLAGEGWYTFTPSRDHLGDVVAAMLVAAGLGAEIDPYGLDVLFEEMCWSSEND